MATCHIQMKDKYIASGKKNLINYNYPVNTFQSDVVEH